jgi:uncharacterized protein (TIGR02145 family)
MKKLFSLIAAIIIISCSTNSDDNGNSTTAVVPVPPTNLLGTVASPTQINLSWTDNSTNETGFKIDRKVGSGNWVTDYGIVSNADVINYSDTSVSAGNTYTYRVSSFNSVGKSLTYSNEVTLSPTAAPVLPTLTTTAASSIAATTAASGGTISSDGGAAITVRGICWSTSPNPTIVLTTKTTDGTGIGAFTSNITGLTANTSYYIKAYATNSQGTAYGNEISFTTLQNANVVPLPNVTIGTQIWSSTNLDVTTYRDGTPIPQVTDPTAWAGLTTGAWCYYNNTTANGITYGKLYNWYAVAGIHDTDPSTPNKILAPQGWHVPSDAEWTTLTDFLGGGQVAGGKMKSTGTSLWSSPNTAATNESGFSGLPGGSRGSGGTFHLVGTNGFWWSSSENDTTNAWARYLNYYVSGGAAVRYNVNKKYGLSVRCLRD